MAQTLRSDAVLHYNVGEFGAAGYAVPNWSNDVGSLNQNILQFVSLIGRNLFNIMHHEDADLRIPPSVNTCKRIHKLYLRSAALLAGNAVPPGRDNMEPAHARPAGEIFRVYPCPFFLVRNSFMRKWANLIFMMMADAMQHTENAKAIEISTTFAGQVGQYVKRVYVNMAVELFQKNVVDAEKDGFALADADFIAYDPAKFFTLTEMTDTVPRLDRRFTEDQLEYLAEGIPVTQLPELKPWPTTLASWYAANRTDQTIGPNGISNASAGIVPGAMSDRSATTVPIIPPPPGP